MSSWLEPFLADLIVGISMFAAGLVLFLAFGVNLPAAIRGRGHERALELSYTAARIGFVIVLVLIMELVFKAGRVDLEWRSILYIIGILLASFGYLGVIIEGRRVRRRDK